MQASNRKQVDRSHQLSRAGMSDLQVETDHEPGYQDESYGKNPEERSGVRQSVTNPFNKLKESVQEVDSKGKCELHLTRKASLRNSGDSRSSGSGREEKPFVKLRTI